MKTNSKEPHKERLGTTDNDGHRIYLYPEEVKGFWKNSRTLVYCFLIVLYLVLPWTKMNGKQTILLDIPAREFFILGGHYYAHDIPLLFILLATFIFSIGVITAIFGRVWCGWACPQTVFIEQVFRRIESFIEGNHRERKKLDEGPRNANYFIKKIMKWIIFTIMALIISHSFLAYFINVEEFIKIVQLNPDANMTIFTIMLVTTTIFLVDFGWFREQFCIIACPYGRLQSVLMDKDSLVVAYDNSRGEPRKVDATSEHGDCVNCYKCISVCPTGIDIRRGTQLECIQCTRCIDICDEVMDHIGSPRGLIRYTTERQLESGKINILRPRVFIYSIVLLTLLSVGGYIIDNSKNVQVLFLRGTKSPYKIVQVMGEDKIVNFYNVEFFYRDEKTLDLSFRTDFKEVELVAPIKNIQLKKSRKKVIPLFFRFDKSFLDNGSRKLNVDILNKDKKIMTKELTLVGPY